jgi:CRISPR-associated protein Cas5 subtype I-B
MNGILLNIEGNWAHFKKPETNNNPLTHDFITKTALIGMIGAVLGKERGEMAKLFPQLSDDLLYGVCVRSAVKKESWAFTLRYAVNLFEKRPKQMEFLKNPRFAVAIALKNERSADLLNEFATMIEASESRFTPVLGLHNCPASLEFVARGSFQAQSGDFITAAFITEGHKLTNVALTKDFRVGVERVPTFQNDDFWNLPERYVKVIYPSEGREINAQGDFYEFTDGSKWTLI